MLSAVGGALTGGRTGAVPPEAPGRHVDVAGTRLHVLDSGPATTPTVVLESALASTCTSWAWVTQQVGGRARTIAPDRAGNGWSARTGAGADLGTTVDRLAKLLDACAVTGPLVLVGHSVGGLVVRAFADRHPDRVAGLVLVDASHPDQLRRSPAQRDSVPIVVQGIGAMLRRARRRAVGPCEGFGAVSELPPEVADRTNRLLCRPEPWLGARAELRAWEPGWAEVTRGARLRPDLPLAVLTAGEQARRDPVHAALQAELADLSTRSRHRTVPGASHDRLVMSPTGASEVAEAVSWVLDEVEGGAGTGLAGARRGNPT